MSDLTKIYDLIEFNERLQKFKKEYENILAIVEGTYNPHEPDLRKALFCDDFEWEHTVSESGQVTSKFYRIIKNK